MPQAATCALLLQLSLRRERDSSSHASPWPLASVGQIAVPSEEPLLP